LKVWLRWHDQKSPSRSDLPRDSNEQIREILREANEKRRALFQQGPPADRQAMFREMQKIREWVDEQISKLLTEQQKKKWQELIGEPFKLEFRPFGGPRGQ
jgi:aminoglycoside/choline kinase family phosphotransferase